MTTINTQNYEAFLLDYSEGRLNETEVLLLRQFIAAHPTLGSWDELTEELPLLVAETVFFEDKHRLKRIPEFKLTSTEGIESFDLTAINYLEGELSEAEKHKFEQSINSDTRLAHELELLKLTYLKTNESIIYPNRTDLKKSSPALLLLHNNYWVGVAAGLLLLISTGWWFLKEPVRIPERDIQLIELSYKQYPKTLSTIHIPNEQYLTHRAFEMPEMEIPAPADEMLAEAETTPVLLPQKPETVNWSPMGQILYDDNLQHMNYYFNGKAYLARIEYQNNQEKSLAGLILANTSRKFVRLLVKNKTRGDTLVESESTENLAQQKPAERFPAIRWAEAGIKTFNLLTDNEVELKKIADDNGRVKAVQFLSPAISFQRNLEQENQND